MALPNTSIVRAALLVSVLSSTVVACSTDTGVATDQESSSLAQLATNAQVACARYFEWDLFRSEHVPYAKGTGKKARRAQLKQFSQLADKTASSVDSAVTVGDLPSGAGFAAHRIAERLSRVVASGGDIADVSGRVADALSGPAGRLEAQCVGIGIAVPDANRDARE